MPKALLTRDSMLPTVFDMDKFKLAKGEIARIVVIETEFEYDWRHFVDKTGYFICLGVETVLKENGSDPNCPFCRGSLKSAFISPSRRNFATHIVRYSTNSKGDLLKPFSVRIELWQMGDDKYNSLVRKKEEWKDLRQRDIKVTCVGEQYQKMEFDICAEALWLTNDQVKTYVVQAYKDGRCPDLGPIIGRKVQLSTAEDTVNKVVGQAPVAPVQQPVVEIDNILGGQPAGSKALATQSVADILRKSVV